jgi:haloalkane dehalogenase
MTSAFQPPPELPGWLETELPFSRRVFAEGGHSIHFVDEGDGPPVLLQHGNPAWCYLWRKVIPILAANNVRVVAPDLIGLGLSSKPRDPKIHTLDFHSNRISSLVEALDLHDLTVVGQDWGGPIAAVMAARNAERIHGAVFANTALRVPTKPPRVTRFHRFSHSPVISDLAFRVFNYPVKKMYLVQGDRSSIGPEEQRAYRYPLRKFRDRAAPLAMARLVPHDLESPVYDALREVQSWAQTSAGEVRLVWGMKDPILGKSIYATRKLFPNAEVVETDAGHFLQEEVPDQLAQAILGVALGR